MVLESILVELEKLNENLNKLATGSTSLSPQNAPDNSVSDESEEAQDVVLAKKKTYYILNEAEGLIIEKGEELPVDEDYRRVTKKEYDTFLATLPPNSSTESHDVPPEENPDQLGLDFDGEEEEEVITEEMCRDKLRELRAALLNSGTDDTTANKTLFKLLKSYTSAGKLPDIPSEKYPNLLYDATRELANIA